MKIILSWLCLASRLSQRDCSIMVVFGLSTLTERLFYHGCVWPLDSHREIVLSWLCLASRLSQRDCSIMVVFGLSTLTERLFCHGCVWPLDSHREIVLSWLCLASRLSQRDCSIMVVFGLSTLTERLFYHGCVWPLDSHREIVLSWLCLASRLSQRDCSIMVVFGLSTLTERLFYHGCVWPLDSHREIVLCLMSLFDIQHSVRSQSLAQCPVGTGYSLLLFEYGESELFCFKKLEFKLLFLVRSLRESSEENHLLSLYEKVGPYTVKSTDRGKERSRNCTKRHRKKKKSNLWPKHFI